MRLGAKLVLADLVSYDGGGRYVNAWRYSLPKDAPEKYAKPMTDAVSTHIERNRGISSPARPK